ncbi:MAG: lipopolysaccharide export system protein LptC [Oceanicoccus sp.]|jgi:lipopolysaccharide export system protein LptC
MNRRKLLSTRNINTVVATFAAIVLIAFLLSYSETGTPPNFTSDSQSTQPADFYLINSHTTTYNQQGQKDFSLRSKQMRHQPADGSIKITAPQLAVFDNGMRSWNITAQTGVIYNNGKKIDLRQRVVINSADDETTLKTPQLFIFPNQKQAHTKKPVTLANANGFSRAIGMKANLNTKKIDLLEQVRSQYEPTATDQ